MNYVELSSNLPVADLSFAHGFICEATVRNDPLYLIIKITHKLI